MSVVTEIHPQQNLEDKRSNEVVRPEVMRNRLLILDAALAEIGVVSKLSSTIKTTQIITPTNSQHTPDFTVKPQPGNIVRPSMSSTKKAESKVDLTQTSNQTDKSKLKISNVDVKNAHTTNRTNEEVSRVRKTGKFVVQKHDKDSGNVGKMVARIIDYDNDADTEPNDSQEQAAADARRRIEQMNLMRLGRKDFGLAA